MLEPGWGEEAAGGRCDWVPWHAMPSGGPNNVQPCLAKAKRAGGEDLSRGPARDCGREGGNRATQAADEEIARLKTERDVLTVAEIAEHFGVAPNTVIPYIAAGLLGGERRLVQGEWIWIVERSEYERFKRDWVRRADRAGGFRSRLKQFDPDFVVARWRGEGSAQKTR